MATELITRKRYNYWEKITQVFAVYLLALQPMLWDKNRYSAITEFKFKAFWIPTVVYLAVCLDVLIYSLFDKDKTFINRQKEQKTEISIPQIFAFIFAVWNVLSALKSNYGSHTWIGMGRFEGVFSALLYVSIFFLFSFWAEYSQYYLKGTTVFCLVFSFISILQLFYDGIIHPEGYNFWSVWFMGTLGNVDCVGGVTAMVVPLLVCKYVLTEDKVWNYIALACIFTMSFLFVIANVDSGKIGLMVAFAVAFPFLFDERKNTVKTLEALAVFVFAIFCVKFFRLSDKKFHFAFGKKQFVLLFGSALLYGLSWVLKLSKFSLHLSKETARKIALIILISVIVIVFLFVFFYKGNIKLIKEASEMLHGRLSDEAGSMRGYIWKTSWWLAKQVPVFGTGPGTFVATYYPYDILETTTDYAHNDFLQIAVCIGIVGLVVYCAFIVSLAVRAFMRAYTCPLIVIFGSACAGYLAHSFFSFSIAIVTPMFWALAGILDKLVRQVDLTSSKMNEKKVRKQ